MSDPIFELASVVLRKSPDYLIRTVWRVLAASGWPIIHDLADAEFVSGHRGSPFMVLGALLRAYTAGRLIGSRWISRMSPRDTVAM